VRGDKGSVSLSHNEEIRLFELTLAAAAVIVRSGAPLVPASTRALDTAGRGAVAGPYHASLISTDERLILMGTWRTSASTSRRCSGNCAFACRAVTDLLGASGRCRGRVD
jgi:hypothetical protein